MFVEVELNITINLNMEVLMTRKECFASRRIGMAFRVIQITTDVGE